MQINIFEKNQIPLLIKLSVCVCVTIGWFLVFGHKDPSFLLAFFFQWAISIYMIHLFFVDRPLSNKTFNLLALLLILDLIGQAYNYDQVPLFTWIKEQGGFSRNSYDRLTHFIQGVLIATLVKTGLFDAESDGPSFKEFFLGGIIVLGFAAGCEIYEMYFVRTHSTNLTFKDLLNQGWLGMQGDMWDAQMDMINAVLGGSLEFFTRKRTLMELTRRLLLVRHSFFIILSCRVLFGIFTFYAFYWLNSK